jgi:predicted SprT family Zn-dependent metalloprotease
MRSADEEIQQRIVEVSWIAQDLFDVDLSYLQTEFTLKGRNAGIGGFIGSTPYVNFNCEAVEKYTDEMCQEIVPHELAHVVCVAKPCLGVGHDYGWKSVCMALGGNGSTKHGLDLSPAKTMYTYLYRSTRDHVFEIGQTRHSRLQNGRVNWYASKAQGRIFKWGLFDRIKHLPFRG